MRNTRSGLEIMIFPKFLDDMPLVNETSKKKDGKKTRINTNKIYKIDSTSIQYLPEGQAIQIIQH